MQPADSPCMTGLPAMWTPARSPPTSARGEMLQTQPKVTQTLLGECALPHARTSDEVVDAVHALLVALQREVRRRLAHAPHLNRSIVTIADPPRPSISIAVYIYAYAQGKQMSDGVGQRAGRKAVSWSQSRCRGSCGEQSISHVCARTRAGSGVDFSRHTADLDGAVQ